ncbi:MAG: flagellar hook-basal body protein FliE, partial [Mesorhizobium sp.]
MIGGIGALQFKPAIDGTDSAAPGLLQGGVGTQASESIGSSFADVLSQAATKTVNTLQG